MTPGETLYLDVGGNGGEGGGLNPGGFNGGAEGGGGGGGASDVRTSPRSTGLLPDPRLLVAGGGGGGGQNGGCVGGRGGNAGEPGEESHGDYNCTNGGGGAGTQRSGGAGGTGGCGFGQGGQLGFGGEGGGRGCNLANGGGGGGGYFGGGGGCGATVIGSGGGGGGSSLVPLGGTTELASPSAQPQIQITYPPARPPEVTSDEASSVTPTSAIVNARVNPNGAEVSDCHFEYGASESYGHSVPCGSLPGSGESPAAVSATLGSLSENTTYHFRIVATNPGGTSYGSEKTFTTTLPPIAVTFTTVGCTTWTAPAASQGVFQIQATGAAGSPGQHGGSGGRGAVVSAALHGVSAGARMFVCVGVGVGGGAFSSYGYSGGAGGGASGVSWGNDFRQPVLVAGGGGGGGGLQSGSPSSGGAAGESGSGGPYYSNGGGGRGASITEGGNGGPAGYEGAGGSEGLRFTSNGPGAGGAGGPGYPYCPPCYAAGGGGGGGGYFGGGGGGGSGFSGGGGGGGSSLVPTGGSTALASPSALAQVLISYVPSSPAPGPPGTTFYVSPSGSDSNPGTITAPWQTVGHVNSATLPAGSTVYFQGGASFSGTLQGNAGGEAGSPITYSSYGTGNATIGEVWVGGGPGKSFNWLTFDHLTTTVIGGRGSDDTIQNSNLGGTHNSAINIAEGNRWHILSNYVHDTGDSCILTQSGEVEGENKPGDSFTIENNTIENCGLDESVSYGVHGIYLKVRNAKVINNTIKNVDDNGISVRYGNSTITGNHISNAGEGIGFFQYDFSAATSHWTENVITGTTAAGIYVSPSDVAGKTKESFVIENNTIGPLARGVHMNLEPTSGTYTVKENTEL